MKLNELNKRIKILAVSICILAVLIAVLYVVTTINNKKNGPAQPDPGDITDLGDIAELPSDIEFDGITFETDYGKEVIDLGDIGKRGTMLVHTSIPGENVASDVQEDNGIRPIESDRPANPPVIEYVDAKNSCQNIKYLVYAPYDADETTPMFIFMHGSSDLGEDYQKYISKYAFVRNLITGSWYPNYIIVCPILPKGTNWISQKDSLLKLLQEVVFTYGGSLKNMYIGGASLGANCLTSIAQSMDFKGAIYMAGYLGSNKNSMSVDEFLKLWSGKSVYYFRDNLFNGGYGYDEKYVNKCVEKAEDYNVRFIFADLNWDHSVGLVDCALLPGTFRDTKGQCGHNGIASMIEHDLMAGE